MSLQETIVAARHAVNGQAHVATPQPAMSPSQGLAFEWTFADPNCHPFEQVEWRELDAEIKDEAGKLIFRQRVHVPASWSDTAAQVVASKYFWGDAARGDDPRTGGREHLVRQLIGRVCSTIARWGMEDGYFATALDARRFEWELTWLCLHQYAAFNSPVWFNVGLDGAYGLIGSPHGWVWSHAARQAISGDDSYKNCQISACYIQSVEDSMEGIMRLATSEAMLFKWGSGTGSDLSPLRSTREKLTGGGKPSGPVSFMRIYDASAGVIKSGGRSRRAAKLQVLRCDHPDIMEYVECKPKEDRKARALITAGYSAGMTGHPDEAYSSVFFQNSNISVRATDAFMERATSPDPDFRKWTTVAVTTGDPVETLDAGTILDAIAAGTWECGDPGMLFDDAMQRWHTSPMSGRINCANPCIEFQYLDDTSCNLASLNLMKFRRADGTFDDVRFRAACRIFITAQEILVDRASYPTQKIAENSHRFRPLGLGFSNLGALIMASGLPYDSHGGRDLAAAVTGIETAQAYLTSAEVAAFKGPFDGFAVNRESMLRVMDKHVHAAHRVLNAADHPEAARLARIADGAWKECIRAGREHGYRNAQATLVPPAGTISFMMDCDTTGLEPAIALVAYKSLAGGGTLKLVNRIVPLALETLGYDEPTRMAIVAHVEATGSVEGAPGLKPEHLPVFDCAFPARENGRSIHWRGHVKMVAAIQPLISGASSKCVTGDTLLTTAGGLVRIGTLHQGEPADSFRSHTLGVASIGGEQTTDAFYYGGPQPTIRVELRSGHSVVCTPNHPLMVCDAGGLTWRQAADLREGDYVAVRYGADMWAADEVPLTDFRPTALYGPQKSVRTPSILGPDLAFLLGAYLADGNMVWSTYSVTITKSEEAVLERIAASWRTLFDIESKVTHPRNRCANVIVASKTICEFLSYLGCETGSNRKWIPDVILRSPRHVVLSFLSGLFLDSYIHIGKVPRWGICLASTGLIDDISAVLTNLGIVHGRTKKWNPKYERHYHEIAVHGDQAKALFGLVAFVESHKAAAAESFLGKEFSQSPMDVVPGISGRDLYEMIPKSKSGRYGPRVRSNFTALLDVRTKNTSRRMLERVAALEGVFLPEWMRTILDDNLHFSPIDSIEDGGVREVFDISVPESHAFVGNGIVNHNTINMPESSTVEDIKAAYVEGWKLGVKAMAIYRDGSKGVQPVSTKNPTAKVELKTAAPSDTAVSVALPPGMIIKGAESEAMTVTAPADAVAPGSMPYVEKVLLPTGEHATAIVHPVTAPVPENGAIAPSATPAQRPRRERLPATRQSITHRFVIGGQHEGYATVGLYPDGRPGELFLKVSKEGSTISGLLDSIAILTSLCLQYGVPADVMANKFRLTRFEPCGPTDNPDLPWATSIPDYIFRWLAGAFRPAPTVADPPSVVAALEQVVERIALAELPPPSLVTGPPCPECGSLLVPAGRCYSCANCGYTGGCG